MRLRSSAPNGTLIDADIRGLARIQMFIQPDVIVENISATGPERERLISIDMLSLHGSLLGPRRPSRGVSHTQDSDFIVADDAVSDDIGIYRYQFAHLCVGNKPAPMGEMGQAISSLDQRPGNFKCGPRVEIGQIVENACHLRAVRKGTR